MKSKVINQALLFITLYLTQIFCNFCSIYCPSSACNSTSYNLCQSCDQVFALDSTMSPNCQPYPPTGYVFEASSSSGLTMTYPSGAQTICGSYTTIKGWFSPSDIIKVQYAGVTRPYQSIAIFFGIVSKGTWDGPEQIQMLFNNMGDLKSRSVYTRQTDLSGLCSATTPEYRYRIRQDYTYTTQNTLLSWDLKITGVNGNTNGQWAITQVLLLLKACDRRCLSCTTSTIICTSCVTTGSYQSFLVTANSSCVVQSQCPQSTYAEVATHVCQSCNSLNCLVCSTVNVCTECASSYYLHLSACVSSCPNGYYPNSATSPPKCESCANQCSQCTSLSVCTACTSSGTYQSFLSGTSCISSNSCPTSTFANIATHICQSCNTSCVTCSLTKDNCTSCISTLYFLSNVCYLTCPNNYYGDSITRNCTLCDQKCTVCSVTSTICSACTTSGVSESFLTVTSCVASSLCPIGTFPDTSTHVCSGCNSSCVTCLNTADNCTSCISSLFYLSNICYLNCPNGYYGNTATGNCTLCDLKCTLCSTAPTICSACTTSGASQSFLTGTSCVTGTSCPIGTYPETSTHLCTTCNSSCVTCSITQDNCTQCILTLYMLSNVCYLDCPAGYYQSALSVKQCLICNAKCTVCDILASNCSSCQISGANQAFLTGSTCVVAASCPIGTYPQILTHICTTCNSSCVSCTGNADTCTQCILGLFYLSNICYSTCPPGYYNSAPATKQCLTCNQRCTVCNVTSTNCSSCTTSGTFQSYLNTQTSTCVVITSCPIGYYGNVATHVCQSCNSSCYNCTGNMDNCLWCATPLYLLGNICYTVCPVTYYGTGGKCILCNQLCLTCTGTSVNQCLSCHTSGTFESYFLALNTTCYTDCPTGYYQVVTDHSCQKCDISCASCTADPSPCQSCNSSYNYFNQTCLAACPAGYWAKPTPPLTYKVCNPCIEQCLTCYGGLDSQCYTCNFDMMVKKSGSYCRPNCMPGWGDILDSQYCVYCNQRCTSCYNTANNCTSCKTSGTNEGFMIITDIVANTGNCYGVCPAGYFGNKTTHFCDLCTSPCKTCSNISTNCTQCITNYYFLNFTCLAACPDGYYINGKNCSLCDPKCSICNITSTNCSVCNPLYPAYLLNLQCLTSCPNGHYPDPITTPSSPTCEQCADPCKTCTWNPSPCSSCNPTYFYFQNTCNTTCYEPGYFPDIVTWECLLCDLSCVRLQLEMVFESVLEDSILVTLKFSQDLNWTQFDMMGFQEFYFDDPFFTLDMFSFEYTVTSPRSYQIRVIPKHYIFIYNLGIYVKIMQMPVPNFEAINQRPFHQSVYNQTKNLFWWNIKGPDVSQQQRNIIQGFMSFSNQLEKIKNQTGMRELFQSGFISLFLPGIQITSAMVLVNGIIPRHMYEGIRVMATAIFYQVPKWEKGASNSRYIFGNSIHDIVQSTIIKRLLTQNQTITASNTYRYELNTSPTIRRHLQKNLPQDWRFKRTGFSTFFIIDIYIQIILIVGVWLILLLFWKVIYRKDQTNSVVGKVFVLFHKVHELSLMYVTIALILQWIYFNRQTQDNFKWISFIVCIVMLVYFLCYQLYIYYDLFQYPEAHINTRSYLMYVTKYGSLLSKIRFEQYNPTDQWSPKIWFRPYNYHILSFHKKFLMMFSLPIFHQLPYAQIICLILLQVMQIVRFWVTWPFNSNFRNIYRVALEFVLLGVFVVVGVTGHMSGLLMGSDYETVGAVGKWYNLLGWIGLGLVLVFNLSVFVINFIDLIRLCTKGDYTVQMDEIRRDYYWQKVKKYQDENQDIKPDIITNWVKLGNLKQIKTIHQDAKFIYIKIQKIKVEKMSDFFYSQVIHVQDLRIRKQGYLYQQNSRRLNITNKIRKFMEIGQDTDKEFFDIFTKIYKKYKVQQEFQKARKDQKIPKFDKRGQRDYFQVVIETFIKINLQQYPDGGRVSFNREGMHHTISLYFNEYKVVKIKEKVPIQGLPLNYKLLKGQQQALGQENIQADQKPKKKNKKKNNKYI